MDFRGCDDAAIRSALVEHLVCEEEQCNMGTLYGGTVQEDLISIDLALSSCDTGRQW
jgi:hypothetical protein